MNKLAVRLDDRQDYETLIKESLTLDAEIQSIWCIKHIGKNKNNPHYHFAIETKSRSDTFMLRFKKLFTKGSGNKHHSRKKWDGENRYIQYTLKEVQPDEGLKDYTPLESVLVLNITRHITGEWIQWYSDTAISRLLLAAQIETQAILDNTPGQICVLMIKKCIAAKTSKSRDIFTMLMKHYIDKGDWLPNKHQVDRYTSYIQYKYCQYQDELSGSETLDQWIEDKYMEFYPTKFGF